MDSSELDRLITIQQESITRSSTGQENVSWVDWAPLVWAKRIPQNGKEYVAASQLVGEVDAIFRIRYRPGVKNKMRVVYESQDYDIQDIQEVERKEGLNLICKVIRELQ
jgi:SPP1 family predicted phage head-tail adaptor